MASLLGVITPLQIKKLELELALSKKRAQVSRKVQNGIQEDPVKRNKFQID